MAERFGARLRQRREEQNIPLTTIADETKIKLSLLEALERDDVSHWPSGIFRRAYIRAYAHAIGLCPDAAVREFLEAHPEPPEFTESDTALAAADAARMSGGPPTRLRNIMGAALDSLSRLRRSPAVGPAVVRPGDHDREVPSVHLEAPAADTASRYNAAEEVSEAVFADTEAVTEPALLESALEATPPARPESDRVEHSPDFMALARLCTALGRVRHARQVQPLLQEAATILDATGVIVWTCDALAEELRPALAYGYSDRLLAQLPPVGRDADNATAEAFRRAETCVIASRDHAGGALVVPLLTPAGCAGVLALELQHASEQTQTTQAAAMMIAALLAQLIGGGEPAAARLEPDAQVSLAGDGTRPILRVRADGHGPMPMRRASSGRRERLTLSSD